MPRPTSLRVEVFRYNSDSKVRWVYVPPLWELLALVPYPFGYYHEATPLLLNRTTDAAKSRHAQHMCTPFFSEVYLSHTLNNKQGIDSGGIQHYCTV